MLTSRKRHSFLKERGDPGRTAHFDSVGTEWVRRPMFDFEGKLSIGLRASNDTGAS
jgi:hypothetical protein